MITNLMITIISAMLALLNAFSSAGAAAQDTNQPWNLNSYYAKQASAKKLVVEFDDTLTAMLKEIEGYSGLDGNKLANSLPDVYKNVRWLYSIMPGVFNGMRDRHLAKADAAEAARNFSEMGKQRTLGVSMGMPVKVSIKAEKTAKAGVYKIMLYPAYGDGSVVKFDPKISYNTNTGLISGLDSNSGLASLGYEMNVKEQYALTSDITWQRKLGYTKIYDDLLLSGNDMVDIATVRLKFKYAGKDWMLQLWKGRYFVTTGGEVGLYNKPTTRINGFYDTATDAERIGMSFRLILDKKTVLVDRPVGKHWWITGFAVKKNVYGPKHLTLETTIVPTNAAMVTAIKGALDKEVKAGTLKYTASADGKSLNIVY